MMTEQKQAWVQFRGIRLRNAPGTPALAHHPDTHVWDRRELEEYARQAFVAGFNAAKGER